MGQARGDTGSKALGAELRRRRGGRSLAEIADVTSSEPCARHVRSVSVPLLSLIENGHTMPSVDTLHALAVTCRVPLRTLVELALGDDDTTEAAAGDDGAAAHATAVEAGQWRRALELADRLAESAGDAAERSRWRIESARAASRVGLWEESVLGLLSLVDDARADAASRLPCLEALVDIAGRAGLRLFGLTMASLARAALEGESHGDVQLAARIHLQFARLTVECHEAGHLQDEHALHEALRAFTAGCRGLARHDAADLQLLEARLHASLGNALVAAAALTRIAKDAEAVASWEACASALLHLGRMRSRQSAAPAARAAFERAALLASRHGLHDLAFEAYFELHGLVSPEESGLRLALLTQCRRHHPFVAVRTPSLGRFEQLLPSEIPRTSTRVQAQASAVLSPRGTLKRELASGRPARRVTRVRS